MKKEISTPTIIGIGAAVLAIAIFVLWRFAGNTGTIAVEPKKSENYIEGIPAYVKEGRPPRPDELPKGAGAAPSGAPGAAGAGQPAPQGN